MVPKQLLVDFIGFLRRMKARRERYGIVPRLEGEDQRSVNGLVIHLLQVVDVGDAALHLVDLSFVQGRKLFQLI